MPETEDFDEFDTTPDESDQFKAMRARANKATKLERENAELTARIANLERQTAFTSAGLSLSEKQQAALLAAHGDTELTADALRATAVELGFAAAPDDGDQQREQATQGQARIAASQAGATPPDPVPDLPTQIIAAEQAGDWTLAMALKAQQVANLAGMA